MPGRREVVQPRPCLPGTVEREGSKESGSTQVSAIGDHTDFAAASSAARSSEHATRKKEMDINLRMGVYGIALNQLTVEYDSSELQRIAFDKAFSPPAVQPSSSFSDATERTLHPLSNSVSRKPLTRHDNNRFESKITDTECFVSLDAGRTEGKSERAIEHATASGTSEMGEDFGNHTVGDSNESRSFSLLANITLLQKEMIERQRKLEHRKAERRQQERDAEMKMRETIFTVQAAIHQLLNGFEAMDDDFDRRASSRTSSQASVWLGTRQGLGEKEDIFDDKSQRFDACMSKRLDSRGGEGQETFSRLPFGEQDSRVTLKQSRLMGCTPLPLNDATAHMNDWPGGQTLASQSCDRQSLPLGTNMSPVETRANPNWTAEELKQISRSRMPAPEAKKDMTVAKMHPMEEHHRDNDARVENVWTTVNGSWSLLGRTRNSTDQENVQCGAPVDDSLENYLEDEKCSPESREFWKRERQKKQEHDLQQTQRRAELTTHVQPPDELHTVYITYEPQDSQGRKAFIGQTLKGKRSGKGVLTWQDGSKYAGEWRNDRPDGFGLEKYQNGSFYVGEFRYDARHGFGEFAVSPEMSYAGQWVDGQMHGIVYIIETHLGGLVKLIPGKAERGEVQRRANDPLSSIVSVQKKVEVAVSNARDASNDARELARSLSTSATEIAKHVIGSRSPSPLIRLTSGGKSPLPPLGIYSNSENSSLGNMRCGQLSNCTPLKRPVSAGGARLLGGGGLPPLPHTSKTSQKNFPEGSRQRPKTAHPTNSQFATSSSSGRHHAALNQHAQDVVEMNPGMRVRLTEDGLASVPASPAPGRCDSNDYLRSGLNACNDNVKQPVSLLDSLEIFSADEAEGNSFGEEDMEAAISLLLADTSHPHAISDNSNAASSCSSPNEEMLALLLGETYDSVTKSRSCHQDTGALMIAQGGVDLKVHDVAPLSATGYMRWLFPIQSEEDQILHFDQALVHSNYQLVRSSRPHITGQISPVNVIESPHHSFAQAPHKISKSQQSERNVISRELTWHPSRTMSERAPSPFFKPSQAFGLSPRSLRLRPLPRSLGSIGTHKIISIAHDHQHQLSPSPFVVEDFKSPEKSLEMNQSMESMNTSPNISHPLNGDRILVAVVTVAAAEVLGSICNHVADNIETIARAEKFVQSSTTIFNQVEVATDGSDKKKSCCKSDNQTAEQLSGPGKLESEGIENVHTFENLSISCRNKNCSQDKSLPSDTQLEHSVQKLHHSEQDKIPLPNNSATADIIDDGSCKNEPELNPRQKGQDISVVFNSVNMLHVQPSESNAHNSLQTASREQGLEELDREVGVLLDNDEDDFGPFLESACIPQEFARRSGGDGQVREPGASSMDGFLSSKGENENLLASPADLAWQLITKFSTGFGLASHEVQAYSRTFVEKPRLRCFVGFINRMRDDQWLQVQNRFVEDAAKAHGVDVEAQTFVREEAFSWVLEKHSQNPVNEDCMKCCGYSTPLITLVSASYEVTSGLSLGSRSSKSFGPKMYEIMALRLLILHSFVETCWRSWQEMIAKATLEGKGVYAHAIEQRNHPGKYSTSTTGPIKTLSSLGSVMPWSNEESESRPVGSFGNYISPLAQRVRPNSSKADLIPSSSSRPRSGVRPPSGKMRPSPASHAVPMMEYIRPFPPKKCERVGSLSSVQARKRLDSNSTDEEALEYIRSELSRSAFANVAEAFAWFDLDGRQRVSIDEVDIGLKSLDIMGANVASLFKLCDVHIRNGTSELEIDELQFAYLFQWNEQLTSNGTRLFLYGQDYSEAKENAKKHQKRIIGKVRAHMQLRLCGDGRQCSQTLQRTGNVWPINNSNKVLTQDFGHESQSVNQANHEQSASVTILCPFCKRSHDHDFVSSLSSQYQLQLRLQPKESVSTRVGAQRNVSVQEHPLYNRPFQLPTNTVHCSLGLRPNGPVRESNADMTTSKSTQNPIDIEQLAAGWDYDSLAQHVDAGYNEFTPHAILAVMVSAVLEHDLSAVLEHDIWSRGKTLHQETNSPRHTMQSPFLVRRSDHVVLAPLERAQPLVSQHRQMWGSSVTAKEGSFRKGRRVSRPPRSSHMLRY